jgi:hypothetical protein
MNVRQATGVALLATLGLAACGGGDDAAPTTAAPTTTTTAAPTTTAALAPTTTTKAATAGDVRACSSAENAVKTAVAAERGWIDANSFSVADYDEMRTNLSDGLKAAAEEADDANIASALLDLQAAVDAKADYSAYLESRSDADFYAWVKNVGDHMTKMNDAMAPVVKACSNVGQTLTPAKFTHFSSTG